MGRYSKNVPEGYAIWINAECLSEDGVEQFEYSTMNLSAAAVFAYSSEVVLIT